jgi:hypothetical protein
VKTSNLTLPILHNWKFTIHNHIQETYFHTIHFNIIFRLNSNIHTFVYTWDFTIQMTSYCSRLFWKWQWATVKIWGPHGGDHGNAVRRICRRFVSNITDVSYEVLHPSWGWKSTNSQLVTMVELATESYIAEPLLPEFLYRETFFPLWWRYNPRNVGFNSHTRNTSQMMAFFLSEVHQMLMNKCNSM